MKKPVLMASILTFALLLLISTGPALASGCILKSVEKANGGVKLVLVAGGGLFEFRNMYPGQKKQAELKIRNDYSQPCHFELNLEREKAVLGKVALLDQLEFTITAGDLTRKGLFDTIGRIDLGTLKAEEEVILMVEAQLPEEVGNEYQDLKADVKFVFSVRTSKNDGEGDDGNGGDDGGDKNGGHDDNGNGGNNGTGGDDHQGGGSRPRPRPEPKPREEIEIPVEEPPRGGAEVPVEPPLIEAIPEPIPSPGRPTMPQTGVQAPYPYYLLGGLILWGGIRLIYPDQRGQRFTFLDLVDFNKEESEK